MSASRLVNMVADRIESGEILTWADGYGVWSARVRDTYAAPMAVARAAIWFEIREREQTRTHTPAIPRVERVSSYDGHTTYREVTD